MNINKVAVIGAGVMGGGIAAQIANGGIPVVLLDLADAIDRNKHSNEAIQVQLKIGGFMHPSSAELVTAGNLDDHLDWLAECDLIIEVIVEKLEIKQSLYKNIEKYRKPNSILSSNTSTIPLENLIKGLSEEFQNNFFITHFFNPPRHMRLLELIATSKCSALATEQLTEFCSHIMGKTVINCNDTAGFIANRIGVFWLMTGLHEAFKLEISVEEADTLIGKVFGIPSTGIFGLFDLIGIDILPKIANSLSENLTANDPFQSVAKMPSLVGKMISQGRTGRKAGGGFYKMLKTPQGKKMEVLDLLNNTYRGMQKSELESIINIGTYSSKDLMEHPDKGGQYAKNVMGKTLLYTASLMPEIANDIDVIDRAMTLGFAWQFGPFELIDRLGVNNLKPSLKDEDSLPPILEAAGESKLYQIVGEQYGRLNLTGDFKPIKNLANVLSLLDIKRHQKPLLENSSASLWEVGQGIVCLEFHSKGNAINIDILDLINQSIALISNDYEGLVIYNEGRQFSSGADLSFISANIEKENFESIDKLIRYGQQTYSAIQQSGFPVIAAISGMSLGGGCEVALHCDVIQAHAETYMGLVEPSVGLVPAWGGCKELIKRHINGTVDNVLTPEIALKLFNTIANSLVSNSAAYAIDNKFILENKKITMNRDHLLIDARTQALKKTDGYLTPKPNSIDVMGSEIKTILLDKINANVTDGLISKHEQLIQMEIMNILSAEGKNTVLQEKDFLDLESKAFMKLIRISETKERIEHMLKTRKPLKN